MLGLILRASGSPEEESLKPLRGNRVIVIGFPQTSTNSFCLNNPDEINDSPLENSTPVSFSILKIESASFAILICVSSSYVATHVRLAQSVPNNPDNTAKAIRANGKKRILMTESIAMKFEFNSSPDL